MRNSTNIKLFMLVKLFLGDGLELQETQPLHWWILCTVTVDSNHDVEMCLCVGSDKVLLQDGKC